MDAALGRYGITLPDRQLACAPQSSPEGQAYLGAMACAANFAWANRHAMAHLVRGAVARVLGTAAAEGTRQVYDVAHNVAKLETLRRARAVRPSQGRDARLPARVARDPRRVPRDRPAGLHPGQHGHVELRPRRPAGRDGALVRQHVPRRRPAALEPHARCGRSAAPSCAVSSRRTASSSAARRTAAWPRRRRSPTRTSSASWPSSSAPASRGGSPSCARSASSRGEPPADARARRQRTQTGLPYAAKAYTPGASTGGTRMQPWEAGYAGTLE